MKSKFAPAQRDDLEEVLGQTMEVSKLEHIRDLLSALSIVVMVLNDKRQVVFANDVLLDKYNIVDKEKIIGYRPGELMSCVHADEEPGGCGTSEACRYCGVVNAILESTKQQKKVTRETRITLMDGDREVQIDLSITAKPFYFQNRIYTIYSAEDISDKKQKEMLERIFFHDIINIAGSLDNIMELMDEMDPETKARFLRTAKKLSNQLVDEITSHQDLINAEKGELRVHPSGIIFGDLLQDVKEKMSPHQVAKDKTITLINATQDEGLISDLTLLERVLVNLVKNALEATEAMGVVTLSAELKNDTTVLFKVHNSSCMPRSVQLQMFQRSFSTKGDGRGLGTYSIKLLSEKYLKGNVTFVSTEAEGTTFFLELPIELKEEQRVR